MMTTEKKYAVLAVEQCGKAVWSRHATLDAARRAARRYRRRNADSGRWVDHHGYEIHNDQGLVETIR